MWSCRVGLHGWRKVYNDRGEMYRTCHRCGVDDDPRSRIEATPCERWQVP
jgi:hypothetical protein